MLTYGLVKCRIVGDIELRGTKRKREIQYHLHATLSMENQDDVRQWDSAINVGTNDGDDLLKYRLVFDYHHPVLDSLKQFRYGFQELKGKNEFSMDFLRGSVLDETGPWRISDVMDGSSSPEPVATLLRLLQNAEKEKYDVYMFGRRYADAGFGIHDVHMNQGSQGTQYFNNGDDSKDHNDIWQDGGVLVDLGSQCAAYFAAFTKQLAPTDESGNPVPNAHQIDDTDPGSLGSESRSRVLTERRNVIGSF